MLRSRWNPLRLARAILGLGALLLVVDQRSTADDVVQSAIDRNTESLAKMESYFLHLVQEGPGSTAVDAPLVQMGEWKIWHSGMLHRQFARAFYSLGTRGASVATDPHGDVNDTSWGDKEVRNLKGWDPEHPFQLPLEFGRNAGEFEKVMGGLMVRDPTAKVNAVEAWSLLWQFYPGWSLKDAAKVAKFVEGEGAEGGDIRLRLESSGDPGLAGAVGWLIDVDPKHGWLVRRIQSPVPPAITHEVLEFGKSVSGDWIAREVRSTSNGRPSSRTTLKEFSINEPLSPSVLEVQFPQGVKVRDSSGMLHLWGDGKPEKSFTNTESLRQHLYASAREYQRGGPQEHPAAKTLWVIVINVVLLAFLVLFILLRRRMSRGA